jgi:hypothetical protein
VTAGLPAAAVLLLASQLPALDGQPGIHDPSTVVPQDGNDRQTVIDDGVSRRLTLHKGPNVVRAAIVNAGGATDFCARFLDGGDNPIMRITVSPKQD